MSRSRDVADGTLDSADINGGTIDGTDITVGSGKTLNISAGTLTTSTVQNQAIVDDATITASDVGLGTTSSPTFAGITAGTATFTNDAAINGVTVGRGTGSVSSNTTVGNDALASNTTGSYNTANGYLALYSNSTGYDNTANGSGALYSNTIGSDNTAKGLNALFYNTEGNYNTAVGRNSGQYITTGSKNTILGSYDGNQGGLDIRTSDNNIVLSDGDGNPRAHCDSSGNWDFNGNTVWHAGNDGSGSGLDADTLDGQEGSYYAPIDLGSGSVSIKKTANTSGNHAAVEVYASGTGDTGSAIAIQQQTAEGDTIIFADYEPFVEWGINTENSANEIHFTAGTSNGSLGSKILKNNAGNDRTAYKKVIINLTNGNVQIGGNLSKSSGSFRIDHPLPEKTDTHHLVHSFVEAPQADNIYRGKVDLVDGSATVNIDTVAGMTEGTFVALNREVQCFTSNESDWDAVRGSITGNILTIESQNAESTATISWLVIGERQDQHMYDTEWTDENGKVIVEPLKPVDAEDVSNEE